MSQPASAHSELDQAAESYRGRHSLADVLASVPPWRNDESFEIDDLTDDEWETFVRAIHG